MTQPEKSAIERVSVIREPDDPIADVRISLGRKNGVGVYLVFRGDPIQAAKLLELAAALAGDALPAGRYKDAR